MLEELKEEVYKANLLLPKYELVTFTWGNVSAIDRQSGIVAIKPSGVSYETLTADDIVLVNLDGKVIEGTLKPSSDLDTHLELYRRFPNIGGIVHTHSCWATSFAQAGLDIHPFGTTHADYFHNAIPCTRQLNKSEIQGDYELETGKVIVETFQSMNLNPDEIPGVLVQSHGPFTWGTSASNAVHNAVVLEECAKMNCLTLLLSNFHTKDIPQYLLDKHFNRKHGPGAYYGQR